MRIRYLQHVPFEDPAGIADWAAARGHVMSGVMLHEGRPLPPPADADGLVVMGGPMGVHDTDRYPWLADERRFIADAIDAGLPVLGVCLGAQLIAAAMGADVYRNRHREIGFFEVDVTDAGRGAAWFGDDRRVMAFHWHGDTFDLPAGCVHLASTPGCANQAFSHDDRVLALQFHVESTAASVDRLIRHCADELTPGPYVQTADRMRDADDDLSRLPATLGRVLDRLFGA